ncbi:MAG: hypothetical protein COA88_04470 [Kordia sp.]|nr:MAG: hypothetical protein COA88_04470 [Kordia sp.]
MKKLLLFVLLLMGVAATAQVANTPPDIRICDQGTIDGFEIFDLTVNDSAILGGQNPADFIVTYHLTLADAQANLNILPTLFINSFNPQSIGARVTETATGNFATTSFNLEVVTAPQAFPFTNPLTYCDTDNDNVGYFDLNTIVSEISGGLSPGIVTVEFYESLAEANQGVGAIDTSVLYENIDSNADNDNNPATQTIYAQLSVSDLDCYTLVPVYLLVINTPVLPSDPLVYSICDDYNVVNDGFSVFDLTSNETDVLLANIDAGTTFSDFTVAYYTDAGLTNQIPNPGAYPNTSTPQTIYANVEYISTGCSSVKEITLHVDSVPAASNYIDYVLCDDDFYGDMDGVQTFDLPSQIPNMIADSSGLVITYYEDGALTNPISDIGAYENIVNPQDVYVQFENAAGCTAVKILKLTVGPNPTPLSTPDIVANLGNNGVMEECDGNVDGSGAIAEQQALFDLTLWEINIKNNEVGVSAAYYTSLNDAEAETNSITTPTAYTNTSNPQTIYVGVINDGTGVPAAGTGCSTIVQFNIYVPVPEVNVVASHEVLCVDANGVPLTNANLPILTATASPGPSAAYNYQWALNGNDIPGATNQTLAVTEPGDYTVTASNMSDAGCVNVSTAQTIGVSGVPVSFGANVTSSPCDASQIIVALVTSTIPGIVFWSSLDGGQPTTNGTFTDVSDGVHTVTFTDGENCWTETMQVTVLECELAQDNLTVETISETCVGLDNGVVQITANEAYTYEVSMSLNGNAITVSPNTFTDVISIPNLASGTYYVCVTAIEVNSTQCYDVYVAAVEDLTGFSGRMGNVYTLALKGSKQYNIAINDVITEMTAATVTETITFEYELSADVTTVKVTTDKECQGRFEETVLLDDTTLVVFPNPVQNELRFSSVMELSSVVIYDMTGKVVLRNATTKEMINVAELMKGVYFIKATSGTSVYTSKFIKK